MFTVSIPSSVRQGTLKHRRNLANHVRFFHDRVLSTMLLRLLALAHAPHSARQYDSRFSDLIAAGIADFIEHENRGIGLFRKRKPFERTASRSDRVGFEQETMVWPVDVTARLKILIMDFQHFIYFPSFPLASFFLTHFIYNSSATYHSFSLPSPSSCLYPSLAKFLLFIFFCFSTSSFPLPPLILRQSSLTTPNPSRFSAYSLFSFSPFYLFTFGLSRGNSVVAFRCGRMIVQIAAYA